MEDKLFSSMFYCFLDDLKKKFDSYVIVYKGKGVSLNEWYSQGHWSKRTALKKKFKPLFRAMLRDELDKEILKKFAVILEYNSKHDTDNITGLEKLFTDSLKRDQSGEGWALEDSKKHFRFYAVKPNEELDKNEFVFNIIKIE